MPACSAGAEADEDERAKGTALDGAGGGPERRGLAGGHLQGAERHGEQDHQREDGAERAVLVGGQVAAEDGVQQEVADVLHEDGDEERRGDRGGEQSLQG